MDSKTETSTSKTDGLNEESKDLSHQKVIAPSKAFVKEMADEAKVETKTPKVEETIKSKTSSKSDTKILVKTEVNVSSIYPTAIDPMDMDHNSDDIIPGGEESTITFSNGFKIGGSIFWVQFVAGLVLSVVFYLIDLATVHTTSKPLLLFTGLIFYIFDFYIALFIPYKIIKNSESFFDFWLAMLGISLNAIFDLLILAGSYFVLIKLILKYNSVAAVIAQDKLVSVVIFIVLVAIGLIAAKIAYGLSYELIGKMKNKLVMKVTCISFVALILLALFAFSVQSTNNRIKNEQKLQSTRITTE